MDDDVLEYVTIGQQAQQQQQPISQSAAKAPSAISMAAQGGGGGFPRLVQRQAVHPPASEMGEMRGAGGGVGGGKGSIVFGQGTMMHQQGPESSNLMSTDNVIAFAPGIDIDVSGV